MDISKTDSCTCNEAAEDLEQTPGLKQWFNILIICKEFTEFINNNL